VSRGLYLRFRYRVHVLFYLLRSITTEGGPLKVKNGPSNSSGGRFGPLSGPVYDF